MLNLKKTLFAFICPLLAFAQTSTSNTIAFQLHNTTLFLKPNWVESSMNGKAVLSISPYFYEQDSLVLDAKGFTISTNPILNKKSPLKYTYNGEKLVLFFDQKYSKKDTLSIEIDYVANPEKIKVKGSDAILSDKGLYFINPMNKTKGLPRQLWTQGETQANSCWFPTIDSPNQKHSQDIYLTVEKNQTTLSNGLLLKTVLNADGTKTDHWQQKQKHAVYLSMIAVGDFVKVVDDRIKDFEVSYYVEPAYAAYAKNIFGRTPEMIRYFEKILDMPFVWTKYAQIPVRKYVSGAMENTTATIHGSNLLKNNNQLVDNNDDGVIAHELFHHWFGDLVTCESWSNLPLNESFANYSEFMWTMHKNGKDEADHVALTALSEYLQEASTKKESLIRFELADKEDMFDAHSYQKGGRVMHMLRQEIGDEAFFKALNLYLNAHKYETAEIDDLRQAIEKVTGKDYRWFFDQWFMRKGHPVLTVRKKIEGNSLKFEIDQVLDSTDLRPYRLSVPVTILSEGKKVIKYLNINQLHSEIVFDNKGKIDNVFLNEDGYFLGQINELEKSVDDYFDQFYKGNTYFLKVLAFESLTYTEEGNPLQNKKIRDVVLTALKDPFWRIRQMAVQKLNDYDGDDFLEIERSLQSIIKTDPHAAVRTDALLAVKNFMNAQNEILFRNALLDTSYAVRAAGLEALFVNNVTDVKELAAKYEHIDDINFFMSVANYYSTSADSTRFDWFTNKISSLEGMELYQVMALYGTYVSMLGINWQDKGISVITNIASMGEHWFVKMAAVQSLVMLAEGNATAKGKLKEIVKNETDPKLIKIYEQIKE